MANHCQLPIDLVGHVPASCQHPCQQKNNLPIRHSLERQPLPYAGGRIEGDVRINGHPKEQSSFARVSGYVEQFDTHSAAATVHEALMFSGILRNEKDIDHDTTEAFVEQVRTAELCCAMLVPFAACLLSITVKAVIGLLVKMCRVTHKMGHTCIPLCQRLDR